MENKNSYTIVGLFFIIALTLFGAFVWWMSDAKDAKQGSKEYFIQTSELPNGVRVDSNVKFVGVVVGGVSAINFLADDRIEITLKIRDDIDLRADSIASVELHPISGIAAINISRGEGESLKLQEHPIIELEASLLSKIGNNAQDITQKINTGLDKLNALFSEENYAHLNSTLKNLDRLSAAIASDENMKNLGEILRNFNVLSKNLSQTQLDELSKNLNTLIANFSTLAKNSNSAVQSIENLGKTLNKSVENGEINVKAALNPILNEASLFIDDFSKTLREMRSAMDRLEENPYEFFFKDTNIEGEK